MSELVTRARLFAIAAHDAVGQIRKYTGEPYWLHPGHVAMIVSRSQDHTEAMLAAAWLHDVVEDTEITADQIRVHFGEEVAEMVDWLSNKATEAHGNRAARKLFERQRLSQAPDRVVTIKMADIISNVPCIVEHDPEFGRTYVEEKALMLGALTGGDPKVRQMAEATIARAREALKEHDER